MTVIADVGGALLLAVVLLVLGYGLTYFIILQVCGERARRRERRVPTPDAPPSALSFYVLVPCRDEALVIGDTVRNLLAQPGDVRVTVIDDGSEDATAFEAAAAGGDGVLLVRRTLPDARVGKGAALNHALGEVTADVARRGLDPADVVVVVMDADGRLSENALAPVGALFADPRTGGVQLPVRIRNRGTRLTRTQDVGFWGATAVAQMGRNAFGTVSLGGNGQFTRLSALQTLDGPAWTASLTEDLDLMISLALRGWRMRATDRASVNQEAPEDMKALIRQRTRWAQGHMVCALRLPEVWRSPAVDHRAAFELSLYLLQPWCLTLPWSVGAPALLALGAIALVHVAVTASVGAAVGVVLGLYVLAFIPYTYGALVYRRRAGDCGFPRALWLEHLSYVANVVSFTAAWRALGRIRQGLVDWDKTGRVGRREDQLPPAR